MAEEITTPGTEVEDQEADQALGDAADRKDEPTEPETDWKAEAEKWRKMSRQNETKAKNNAEAAKKLKEFEDREKTEAQRLQEALTERDVQLKGFQVAEVRRNAALEHGLDADMAQFITAADADEASEQARILAAKMKPAEAPRADFKQGNHPAPPENQSPDDALRAMFRRGGSR